MDPRGTVSRLYKEDHYTQNMKALVLVVSEEKIVFFMFYSHCKSMGVNDPWGGAIFDVRGMADRIYKEDHYTLQHTKYESVGPCDFGKEDFFYVFPMTPRSGACMDPRGTVGRIYKDDH